MLEKITNINLRSEFFSDKKAISAYKNAYRTHPLRNDLHDSVNISPAYRFLSQVGWQLKEMTNLPAEKIYVAFYFAGYEFQTTVDLSNLTKLSSLEYTVIKNAEVQSYGDATTATLSVSINKRMIELPEVLTDLPGLRILFNRLNSLDFKEELNFNSNILFELFDGILSIINKEFDYLNNCLFAFIEKVLNVKLFKFSSAETGLNWSDSPNRIKLLNVDARKN